MSPRTSPWDEDSSDDVAIAGAPGESSVLRAVRWALFAINFLASLALCLKMMVAVAVKFDPQTLQIDRQVIETLLWGILWMLPTAGPFGVYGWFEWRAWHDGNAKLVRKLGYCNLVAAALVLLFLLVELSESLIEHSLSRSLVWFPLAVVPVAIYLVVCGLVRVRFLARS